MIQHLTFESSTSGESPPPPPRACFGRSELIERIVCLAKGLTPVALIGAGGIGKTSVALAVLHHDRIKERFGDNRRFIRCDQFPASGSHFLSHLSNAIGAGIENLENLTPLRPSLSSKEMAIVLDNAESILDPQGANGREIYCIVEELSQFSNICLVITSRITTIPPICEAIEVQTLSTEAAHDTFYNIYKHDGRPESVNGILKELDFHPLSVALLATVAHQNRWDSNRLVREWENRQTGVLETEHRTSLATTIELSLASPMFKELGADARGLLGVVAFYPQGINEESIDWLFPTIFNRTRIFDKFCILSLTYRSNGFITMLAPLRDHLRPKDPTSSPLLCGTKERYFARMSVKLYPNGPGFGDARWIVSEDVNVEHLLDVFTSVNPGLDDAWEACTGFLEHLTWHKPRQTVLRRKIEGLPDDHCSKPKCLYALGSLHGIIGNYAEKASFLNHALKLERERGDDNRVALTLTQLSDVNQTLGHLKEGIDQAREALEIFERLGETAERANCLNYLAFLLKDDGQLGAAEEATLEAIKLLPEKGQENQLYLSHSNLGGIYQSKGEREKAIYHYELALGIASTFDWGPALFSIHLFLTILFLDEDGFDKAQVHAEQAKSHVHDNPYFLGVAVLLQATVWLRQRKLEDAASEVLHAQDIFEKLGNQEYLEASRDLLQEIEEAMKSLPPPGKPDSNGKLLGTVAHLTYVNSPFFSPWRIIKFLNGQYSL